MPGVERNKRERREGQGGNITNYTSSRRLG